MVTPNVTKLPRRSVGGFQEGKRREKKEEKKSLLLGLMLSLHREGLNLYSFGTYQNSVFLGNLSNSRSTNCGPQKLAMVRLEIFFKDGWVCCCCTIQAWGGSQAVSGLLAERAEKKFVGKTCLEWWRNTARS